MARVRIPSGTIQKLETVFDDLQTFINSNQKGRLDLIFKDTFGHALNVVNGSVVDSDLEVIAQSSGGTPTQFQVNAGKVLTRGNKYINLVATHTQSSIPSAIANTYYLVRLRYAEQGTNLQTSMSSFLYDPLDGETSQYTRFTDSYVIEAVPCYPGSGWEAALGDPNTTVPLGILMTNSSVGSPALEMSAWTFVDSIEGVTYTASSAGVVDLRYKNVLRLDTDLLDDSKVLLKDRDSWDSSPITGDVKIVGLLKVDSSGEGALFPNSASYFQGGVISEQPIQVNPGDAIFNLPGNNSLSRMQIGRGYVGTATDREAILELNIHRTNQDRYYTGADDGQFDDKGQILKLVGSNEDGPETDYIPTGDGAMTTLFRDLKLYTSDSPSDSHHERAMVITAARTSSSSPNPNFNALSSETIGMAGSILLNVFNYENSGTSVTPHGIVVGPFALPNSHFQKSHFAPANNTTNDIAKINHEASIYTYKGLAVASKGDEGRGIIGVIGNFTGPDSRILKSWFMKGFKGFHLDATIYAKPQGMEFGTKHDTLAVGSAGATRKMVLTPNGTLVVGSANLSNNFANEEDVYHPDTNMFGNSNKLYVDGGAQVKGGAKVGGDLKVDGITSLTGAVTVGGLFKAMGGVELPSPLHVSGLTSTGPVYFEKSDVGSVPWLSLRSIKDDGSLVTKAKVAQAEDGGALFNLTDNVGASHAEISTSGVFFMGHAYGLGGFSVPKQLSLGSNSNMVGGLHDAIVKIAGVTPGLYFRASYDGGTANSPQPTAVDPFKADWVMGAGTGNSINDPDTFTFGVHTSASEMRRVWAANSLGNLYIKPGSAADIRDNGWPLSVNGNTRIYGQVKANTITSEQGVAWPATVGDLTGGAGVSAAGNLTVGTDETTNFNAAIKGTLHVWDQTTPLLAIGTSAENVSAAIGLNVNNHIRIFNGTDAAYPVLETLHDGRGVQLQDVKCVSVSGSQDAYFDGNIQGQTLTAAGSNITGTAESQGLLVWNNAQFGNASVTMSGVSNDNFYVGVGTKGTGNRGLKVLTESVTPTTPCNSYINDVKPYFIPSMHKSVIVFKKNYEKVQGTGVNTTGGFEFQVDTATTSIDISSDKLKGKYFKINQNDGVFTYEILNWDNVTKRIQIGPVTNTANPNPMLTREYGGEQAIAPDYAEIIDVGEKYRAEAIATDPSGNQLVTMNTVITGNQSNNIPMVLELGQHYSIRSRNEEGIAYSDWETLASGIYDPDQGMYDDISISGQSDVAYGHPFLNRLPMLPDDGTLDLSMSPFGFDLLIGGWHSTDPDLNAQEFEIGWSTASDIDFSLKGQVIGAGTQFMTTENRNVSINVNEANTYTVAVRPLQNGQVVGLKKQGVVTTGGGGAPSDYVGYFFGEINIGYFDGAISDASAGTIGGMDNGFITIPGCSFIKSPKSAVASGISISQDQLSGAGSGGKGSKIEITNSTGAISYGISPIVSNEKYHDTGSGDTIEIETLNLFDTGWNTNGNKFVIGGTKNSRKIGEFTVTTDITIKVAVVDIEWASGLTSENPGVIRVYQEGQEAQAGTMNIGLLHGGLSQIMEVEILGSVGPRTIIIDAFDPDGSSPNNTCSIFGTIELYGQAITNTQPQIAL